MTKEQVADLKEVFMLFDKDEDGVLTFHELEQEFNIFFFMTNSIIFSGYAGPWSQTRD